MFTSAGAATFTGAGKNLRASDFLTVRCGICGENSGLPVCRVRREVIKGEVQVDVELLVPFDRQVLSVSPDFLAEIEEKATDWQLSCSARETFDPSVLMGRFSTSSFALLCQGMECRRALNWSDVGSTCVL
mmetsp:Transcript_87405/g.138790  ORF Transcript_87405/g.138790 Transcript_87405/m.138790 type:complete len:131 (-) Transcript_87405:397-789(-)